MASLTAGVPLAGCGGSSPAQTSALAPPSAASSLSTGEASSGDKSLLNFSLNLQYLASAFYTQASSSSGLSSSTPAGSPNIARYASEIAADKAARLTSLQTALGGGAISQPAVQLSAGGSAIQAVPVSHAASEASVSAAAGAPVNASAAADQAFLLGGLQLEDVSAAAFRGAITQLSSAAAQAVMSDLLADATYHAGLLRSALLAGGMSDASLKSVSDARQRLDGVSPPAAGDTTAGQDIVTSNGYVMAFARSPAQVLNILYQSPSTAAAGGYFPQGVNGAIRLAA